MNQHEIEAIKSECGTDPAKWTLEIISRLSEQSPEDEATDTLKLMVNLILIAGIEHGANMATGFKHVN